MALILSAYVLQDTVSSASPLGSTIGVFFFFSLLKEEGKESKKSINVGGKVSQRKIFLHIFPSIHMFHLNPWGMWLIVTVSSLPLALEM